MTMPQVPFLSMLKKMSAQKSGQAGLSLEKLLLTVLSALVLLSLFGCQSSSKQPASSSTAPSTSTSSAMSQKDSKNLTPEQVAEEEGNHTEQVVVQVTADGYVTSHGDHYHFYNGKVAYEALLSRELVLSDESYVLDSSHIVSDVVDGHIIKIGEEYFLYLTSETPQNLR